jgi:hypothetical protein
MQAAIIILSVANVVAFGWFVYEIIRLEGWPFRKWHHAYLAPPLWVAQAFVPLWLTVAMLVVALAFILDDASQHRVHNRLKREGKPPSEWTTSRLHRIYEAIARWVMKLSARG